MANSNKEQNQEIEPNEPLRPKSNIIHCKNKSLINGLTCIIALTALIIAGYVLHLNLKIQHKLANENTNLSAQLEELKQTQTSTQEQIDAKAKALQSTQDDLQNKLITLNIQVQSAINQHLYQEQDWLLLKARYYLELEQINTYWSDNFKTTIALLQQADDLLKQVNKPQIFVIRQAIAKEINLLKATQIIDTAGLLSQLDVAQITVGNLTIQSTAEENEPEAQNETPKTSNPSAWRQHIQNSVNLLKQLVVIRRNNEDMKPLMSPLFESILRESIRLNLQEAQWAVLNNNPVVYQLAIKQTIMNSKRTFNETAKNTGVLMKQLNDLRQVKLIQEKPKTGLALTLLNQMIDTKTLDIKPQNNSGKGEN